MEIRLYRALPEHLGPAVQPPATDEDSHPAVSIVCLERDADPDANNHTGYDYWGAYADEGELLDAWEAANTNTLEPIDYTELPNPVTFYPAPFSGGGDNTIKVRARDDQGRFVADDPATPDVNEAWTEIVL